MENTPDDEDKSHWTLWVFYYNRDDKRVFVPKRSGLGWTLNFANPYAVAVLLAMLAVSIAIMLMWPVH